MPHGGDHGLRDRLRRRFLIALSKEIRPLSGLIEVAQKALAEATINPPGDNLTECNAGTKVRD
jgi:hypothetical protein